MKIREGKYYRTRGGDDKPGHVVGPMQARDGSRYCWKSGSDCWTDKGEFSLAENAYDLISEAYVTDTPPPSRLERYPAPPGLTATTITNGLPHAMPETKTLRDELEEKAALAILSGYYASPSLWPSKDPFGDIWDAAKGFVEARKK
jgi:hypothetical protein